MSSRRLISSGSPFEHEIGYSRAVVDGDWVFVSGTTGFDYASMTVSDDGREQTEQCFRVLRKHFGEIRPAATMIVAALVDPRIRIEIEVTARRIKK
jgi:enamine deaminase RidA (YjgF/YER057c/UK114 family)